MLRRYLNEAFRASADYVLIVWWGIPLALALLAVSRIHPTEFYGEPPSPLRLAASLFLFYAYLAIRLSWYGLVGGALLSLGAQFGRRAGMRPISMKVLGAIGSCVVTLILVKLFLSMLAGDLVSLTVVGLLSFVLPIVFGFNFLVGLPEPKSGLRISARHWLAVALPVLLLAQSTVAQIRARAILSSVHDPRFDLVFVKWQPGPGDLSQGFSAAQITRLTDHEIDLLRESGLRGHLQPWAGAGTQSAGMRAVVIMYRPIHADVDLPKPLDGDVMYLQTPNGWRKIPDFAVTSPRNIRLSYVAPNSQHTEAATKYFVDNGFGISPTAPTIFAAVLGKGIDLRLDAFSWTTDEEQIDPTAGLLSPPANSR
jgi:hypothetical protein